MKGLTVEQRLTAVAVKQIADNRVANVGCMHPNLMRSPGFEVKLYQGQVLKILSYPPMGDRPASIRHHRHFFTILGVPPNIGFNHAAFGLRATVDQTQVKAARCFGLDLRLQGVVGSIGFRDRDHAAGIFIEAVDNTRTVFAVNLRQLTAVGQQGMHQSASLMASTRMHHHPLRLIDNQQLRIFVENIKGDYLRHQINGDWLRLLQLHPITHTQQPLLIGAEAAIAPHMACFNQLLHSRSRQMPNLYRQPAIQTLTVRLDHMLL